jgi:phospho-N-acetylmuramoyl-pentapeptide-transferase
MLLGFLLGPYTVTMLKKLRATAPSRLKGLVADEFIDAEKDKTPSMGGVLIILSITVATLLWGELKNPLVLVFLGTLLSLGALGFLDDYVKVVHHNRDGISGKLKLLFQFLIAIAAVYFLDQVEGTFMREIRVPFLKTPLLENLPLFVIIAFATLVMVGSSNAVNLTDGKDGLAVGCTISCTMAYAVFAYMCGHKIFADYLHIPFIPGASEVVVFAAAIIGACTGFLWHNCHPASMFMGDTGSLALGGTIGLIAVLVKQELALVIVGGVFVMEALSVVIQVASFKLRGKRVFLCAPIHHHFEQKGWTETQIVVRFWILSGIFALIGLATLKLR